METCLAAMDELTTLLLAARQGDRVALHAFIRRTQGQVHQFNVFLVGTHEADDLTQEAYLRILQALPGFRGESSARTWLFAIVRRAYADWVRRRRRRRLLQGRPSALIVPDPTGLVSVEALVAQLDEERRLPFVLTQVVGLSYAEAAEVCSCPIGTIRSRVARARAELIDQLGRAAKS